MDAVQFSLRRVGEENLHYYESDTDSPVQLVFVPGGLNPELWKQQLRYFSKSFRTVSFKPTVSFRDLEGERSALKNVLDQEHLDNVVLVANSFGNSLIQEFEDRENVISTVLTGPRRKFEKTPPRKVLNWFYRIGKFRPKIAKKLFFFDDTEYSVVKDFMDTLEKPDYSDFRSFMEEYSVSRPSKDSLVIHAAEDRLSGLDFARELEPNASLSKLDSAGTFSFFEKPQDFNKALLDFIQILERQKESEEFMEIREKNRSLMEFEDSEKESEGEEDEKDKFRKQAQKVKV